MSARHDLRLVPVGLAAWAAAWLGTSGWSPQPGPLIVVAIAVGLVAVRLRRRSWLAVCLAVFAITLVLSGVRSWQRHDSPVARWAERGMVATAVFVLDTEPLQRESWVVAQASLIAVQARGVEVSASVPVVVLATGDLRDSLLAGEVGARYSARVKLGGTDPDDTAAAVLALRAAPDQQAGPGPLRSVANGLRAGLRRAVQHSPPAQAALVPSLVVGDTTAVDDQMRSDFQATGLTHLMAVSGANLTLLLAVLLAVVRRVGVRGWAVRIVTVAGVAGFVLVCGPEPSVLRATAMGLVALAATGVGAGRRSLRGLALAIALLVWVDPWLSRSVGFALSVAACAGIVLLAPSFLGALRRHWPRWVAEAVAVPLAAQLATQPIVTAMSGSVSMVGVLTNAAAGPFVGPTTVLGLVAALVCWLPPVSAGVGWAAGWCAQPILWLASIGSRLDGATWQWRPGVLGVVLVTVGAAALAVVLAWLLRTRWGVAALVGVVLAASLWRPTPLGWPGEWAVVFCDVGQGDATVVRAGAGAAILVDAGPEPEATLRCLDGLGVRSLPLLVLTHFHADHTGGAAEVIARFRPALVLVRQGAPPRWLTEAAAVAGTQVRETQPGEGLTVGEATWTTAASGSARAPAAEEGEGSAENDASVVAVASSGGVRVLLPGDVEPAGQTAALRQASAAGVDLSASVLKLPHHGSARQESRFFAATGAVLAVASAGLDNDYGHPAQAALDLSREQGMTVARTDLDGSIAVAAASGGLVLRTERGDS